MRRTWLRPRHLVAAIVLACVALVMGLVAAYAVYPASYVNRLLAWRGADVDDQFRFPRREIRSGSKSVERRKEADPQRVRAAFASTHDGADLEAMLRQHDTLAFLVLQHGQLVYEGYFGGHQADAPVTSFSVAKSLLSTLILLAVADGRIGGLDDAVTRYVPELVRRDARFDRITLRHLLQMRSGIRYREFPFFHGDDAKTYYWPDLRELALNQTRIDTDPGGAFVYNNYHPLLLGLVLERATGLSVTDVLSRRVWQPAGLGAGASWSLDSEASGFEKLESGVNARALDFARFGQLFLDDGLAADGTRVLPAGLVQAATGPDGAMPLDALRPGLYYQLMWWGQRRPDGGHDFSARGNHGQYVFVSPSNAVVIVRFGRRYGQPAGAWMRSFEALADALGPAGRAVQAPLESRR
jgi:CubicO group peptidase (beta-lactamase class C family)